MGNRDSVVLIFEKSTDLTSQAIGIPTQKADTFVHIAEVDQLCSRMMQEQDFLIENVKEGLQRARSGLTRRTHQ